LGLAQQLESFRFETVIVAFLTLNVLQGGVLAVGSLHVVCIFDNNRVFVRSSLFLIRVWHSLSGRVLESIRLFSLSLLLDIFIKNIVF